MARLVVDLVDGFEGDDVELVVDGEVVERLEDVRTSLLVGTAARFEVAVADGRAEVAVRVPARSLEAAVTVEPGEETHLVASIDGGRLVVGPAPPSFGFA